MNNPTNLLVQPRGEPSLPPLPVLLVDDIRDLAADVIARTWEAAKLVYPITRWKEVIMDHDLGDPDPAKNGYTFLCWAIEESGLPKPYSVALVTSNPVGRDRMQACLLANGYDRIRNLYVLVKEE